MLAAESADEGLTLLKKAQPDVVLLDIMLTGTTGLRLFERLRKIDEQVPVIFITAGGVCDTVIEAMKLGALDFLLKPLDVNRLKELVRQALEIRHLMAIPVELPEVNRERGAENQLIGRSPQTLEVYKAIGRAAPRAVTVLIRGESGTGKELIERAIYQHSERRGKLFLAVSCAALPKTLLESELFGHETGLFSGADHRRIGKFEQCNGGTGSRAAARGACRSGGTLLTLRAAISQRPNLWRRSMSIPGQSVPGTPAEGSARRWQPLNSRQRRVLGVLVEKAKTTPDAYPMTLNGLVAGCNQKSNREPQMNMSPEEVEQALEELRALGAVTEVQGSGRVPKYRHHAYEWLGVDKTELAVMTELLLRGEQTLGELRGRAARMEPIADQAALKPVVDSLLKKGLMVELTPPGRGQVVTHNLYKERELTEIRAQFAGHVPPAGDDDEGPRPSIAGTARQAVAARSPALAAGPAISRDEFAELNVEVAELRAEVARLREQVQAFESKLNALLR